jgi:hypothetical protein
MNSSPSPESDPLAAAEERRLQQLFRDGATDYIDDAGFTARVLGRLPVARQQREWRRRLLLGAAALAGAAGAAVLAGPELAGRLDAWWAWLVTWTARPVPGIETMATFGSLTALLGTLVVAWWASPRQT